MNSIGYKLEMPLGRGTVGETWKASSDARPPVALKIIDGAIATDVAKGVRQGLDQVKHLRHPALLPLHAFWSVEDRLIICMELADESLLDRLRDAQRGGQSGLPQEELVRFIKDVAGGLDFLHGNGHLHLNVKPQNMLLVQGRVKLSDAFLSPIFRNPPDSLLRGAPVNVAPEFLAGTPQPSSDQYALACSYAWLRRGRTIFRPEDMVRMMMGSLPWKPDLLGLSAGETEVVARAIAREPGERFSSCGEFAAALERTC